MPGLPRPCLRGCCVPDELCRAVVKRVWRRDVETELLESGKINSVTTPRIWVDYTIYGRSRTVTARLLKREPLKVGQEVIVEGDTVDDARAVITAIEGADVHLRLLIDEDT